MAFVRSAPQIQDDAQRRQIEAQDRARAEQAGQVAWGTLMRPMEQPDKVTPTPINWQHSADTGAQRAMGLEQTDLHHRNKMDEIAQAGEQDRLNEQWKIQMRLKYAPRGAGPNPITKLVKEHVDLNVKDPADNPEQAARIKGRLQSIESQLKRYGSRGLQALQDLDPILSHRYQTGAGTKVQDKAAQEEAGVERFKAQEGYKKELNAPETQRKLEQADRSLGVQALSAAARAMKAPSGADALMEPPQAKVTREQRGKALEKLATPSDGTTKLMNGKRYTVINGQWHED